MIDNEMVEFGKYVRFIPCILVGAIGIETISGHGIGFISFWPPANYIFHTNDGHIYAKEELLEIFDFIDKKTKAARDGIAS